MGVGASTGELASAVVGVTVVYVVAVEVCRNVEYTVCVVIASGVYCLRAISSCSESATGMDEARDGSNASESKAQPKRSMIAGNHEQGGKNQKQSKESAAQPREQSESQ